MNKPNILKAKQPSNVAIVTLQSGQRNKYWCFYTHSFGGTQWDDRTFKTRDQCVKAAIKSGFKVKVKT